MLRWPASWERTPPGLRSAAYLGLERAKAEGALVEGLRQMGASAVEVTCDPMWRDPSGLVRMPADPGVAVWCLTARSEQYVLACDAYMTVRDNISSLLFLVDGVRQAVLRGAGVAAGKMFEGLRVVPEDFVFEPRVSQEQPPTLDPTSAEAQWWQLFGFSIREAADLTTCEKKYRAMVKKIHPDKPDGDAEAMRIWTEAIQAARKHFDS